MGETIKIKLNDSEVEAAKNSSLLELSKKYQNNSNVIVAAKVDNQLKELRTILENDCKVEFIDLKHNDGMRIYIRSLTLLLLRAAKEILGDVKIIVEHSIGNSLYCEVFYDRKLTQEDIAKIKERMKSIIQADENINKTVYPKEEALKIYEALGNVNKYNVIKYRDKDTVNIYTCG